MVSLTVSQLAWMSPVIQAPVLWYCSLMRRSVKAAHSFVFWSVPGESTSEAMSHLSGQYSFMWFPLTWTFLAGLRETGPARWLQMSLTEWWYFHHCSLLSGVASLTLPSCSDFPAACELQWSKGFLSLQQMNYFHYTYHYKTPSKETETETERSQWWGGFVLNTTPVICRWSTGSYTQGPTCNTKSGVGSE